MTTRKREIDLFWAECVYLFTQIKNISLVAFSYHLSEIVNKYEESITELLNSVHNNKKYKFAESEKVFLEFSKGIDPDMFVIGSTGDNFETIVSTYIKRTPSSEIEIWHRISNLLWDLITFTTQVVCPQCKSDHLRILTDADGTKLYKSCETCLFTESNGHTFQRQGVLFPANRTLLIKEGLLEQ